MIVEPIHDLDIAVIRLVCGNFLLARSYLGGCTHYLIDEGTVQARQSIWHLRRFSRRFQYALTKISCLNVKIDLLHVVSTRLFGILNFQLGLLLNFRHFFAKDRAFVCITDLVLFYVLKSTFDIVHVIFYFSFFKYKSVLKRVFETTIQIVEHINLTDLVFEVWNHETLPFFICDDVDRVPLEVTNGLYLIESNLFNRVANVRAIIVNFEGHSLCIFGLKNFEETISRNQVEFHKGHLVLLLDEVGHIKLQFEFPAEHDGGYDFMG
jgi:hypothetical protein